jgi:hypothetical protein
MTNDEAPKTKTRGAISPWSLGLGHLLVIGAWGFELSRPSYPDNRLSTA